MHWNYSCAFMFCVLCNSKYNCNRLVPFCVPDMRLGIKIKCYLAPRMAMEFVDGNSILCIHHRRDPITPNPPDWYAFCWLSRKHQIYNLEATINKLKDRGSTFGYDESSKNHNNQQSKWSKGVSNYHITAQRCHDPEKGQRCLVQKEKQQKLSQKSADGKKINL